MSADGTAGDVEVDYRSDADDLEPAAVAPGFFDGWAEAWSAEEHVEVLRRSDLVELAIDRRSGLVVGHATALTDGMQGAFVSLLEVVPEWQRRGVGTELMRRMLARLAALNGGRGVSVDLGCDGSLVPFYERLGMHPGRAMMVRPHLQRAGTPR